MRRGAALTLALCLLASACGHYGPPERVDLPSPQAEPETASAISHQDPEEPDEP